jgi:hypothetical protein
MVNGQAVWGTIQQDWGWIHDHQALVVVLSCTFFS